MKLFLRVSPGVLILAAGLWAASVPLVTGEILGLGGAHNEAQLYAELAEQGAVRQRVTVHRGEFEFRAVEPGRYELRITDAHGEPLAQDFVTISGPAAAPLQIRLREVRRERPVSGVVSLARLRHRPPRKAAAEYVKGSRALERGEYGRAAEHFEKAVSMDPAYLEAHNNLGSCRLRLGDLPGAERSLRMALALDPRDAIVQGNLAAVLVAAGRPAEAEAAARRALELGPGAPKLHYVLALALRDQGRQPVEAIGHFRRAAAGLPQARLAAANLLAALGDRDAAAEELRQYLKTSPPDHARVAAWLSALQRSGSPK